VTQQHRPGYDAATGTLTVSVKGRQDAEAKDQEFKISDTTKVTVYGEPLPLAS
jgi:hypothetical protein